MKARDNPQIRKLEAGPYIVRMIAQVQSWGTGVRAGFNVESARWLVSRNLAIAETPLPVIPGTAPASEPASAGAVVEADAAPVDVVAATKKASARAPKGKRSKTSSK